MVFKKEVFLFLLCFGVSLVAKAQVQIPDQQEIVRAFRDGSVTYEAARAFLANGGDVNASDRGFGTLLFLAIFRGRTDIVPLLLEYGADVNVPTTRMNSIHFARDGYAGIIAVPAGTTPLMIAVKLHKTDTVRLLLEAGADVQASNSWGFTAMVYTGISDGDDASLVRLLVEAGANVHDSERRGLTASIWASANGHVHILRALIEAGADVNASSSYDLTGLLWASAAGEVGSVELLVEAGADVNASWRRGKTPLMHASDEYGDIEMVNVLLESPSIDVDASTSSGFTALMFASMDDEVEAVEVLLSAGADVHAVTVRGHTPLMFPYFKYITRSERVALEDGRVRSRKVQPSDDYFLRYQNKLKILLANGADPNQQDHWGCTALGYVLKNSRLNPDQKSQVMEIFTAFGADQPQEGAGANCDPESNFNYYGRL